MIAASDRLAAADLPLVLTPADLASDNPTQLIASVEGGRSKIVDRLYEHGAVLFRGFGRFELEAFERFVSLFTDGLRDYVGGASLRTRVHGQVFTSTEFPARHAIPPHHEGAYLRHMPRIVGFYCRRPAASGGQTPLADGRRVLARLPASVRTRFETARVTYISNLPNRFGFGQSWQRRFQSDDKEMVEQRLRADGYDYAWKPDGSLHTALRCPAVRTHPVTGTMSWVAQVHLWHLSGSHSADVDKRIQALQPDECPMHVTYGDGAPIETTDVDLIRRAVDEERRLFEWRTGDVLVCDNFLAAHGRQPYEGDREVFVALG